MANAAAASNPITAVVHTRSRWKNVRRGSSSAGAGESLKPSAMVGYLGNRPAAHSFRRDRGRLPPGSQERTQFDNLGGGKRLKVVRPPGLLRIIRHVQVLPSGDDDAAQ